MYQPGDERPIGMVLWNTVNVIHRAFDDALGAVGGSRPIWFILITLKSRPAANQTELAAAVGIQGATLTHHLTAMETDGLLTRRRDPANRRVHMGELTAKGEAAFRNMRDAALEFDQRLRDGIPDADITQLRDILAQLRSNVSSDDS
jgi:MarR family transcriptional regulator, transcriptional regulator for hemolysin